MGHGHVAPWCALHGELWLWPALTWLGKRSCKFGVVGRAGSPCSLVERHHPVDGALTGLLCFDAGNECFDSRREE